MGCLYIQLWKEKNEWCCDVSVLLNTKYLYFLHMRSCKLCGIYSKYVRAICSWPMHIMCEAYEAGVFTNFIKSTNKIRGSVMYCVRLRYKRVTDNIIKSWHIHHPSYKQQYYNTTHSVCQVCHPMFTSCQVLHSLIVCLSCYHLHWYY